MTVVHLSKLAVGIRDVAQLREVQAARAAIEGVLRHRTRMAPKRAAELTAGGSIFWVIAGTMLTRQRVLAVEPARRDDGAACVALVLDPLLVSVLPRAMRPFQGWRYLEFRDAPPDLSHAGAGAAELPEALIRELQALALL